MSLFRQTADSIIAIDLLSTLPLSSPYAGGPAESRLIIAEGGALWPASG